MKINDIKSQEDLIVKLYQNNYSSGAIAEYLHLPAPSVVTALRRRGVLRNYRKAGMIQSGRSLALYDPEIISLTKAGYSQKYIARRIGAHPSSISYRLKINNVPAKTKSNYRCSIRHPRVTLDMWTRKEGTPEFDYILGLLATDGNIYRNCVRIGSIADNNMDMLYAFRDFLDYKVDITGTFRKEKKATYYSAAFKNQDVVEYLSGFGITPKKTFNVKLRYINWHVLRGIFDGDGSITHDKRPNHGNKFEIVTASQEFAKQINDFLLQNGIKSHVYQTDGLYDIVVLGKSSLQHLFDAMYTDANYYIRRKYAKFKAILT